MSIFVGVIRIIVKIGRLQMGLHLFKKCVMFNLSSNYHLKDIFSYTIFSPLILGKGITSSKPYWLLLKIDMGGGIEFFVYDYSKNGTINPGL